MSFKKAFQKQDDQLAEIHALQVSSVNKIKAKADDLEKVLLDGNPIAVAEVNSLISLVQVLKNRCAKYQTTSQKLDFIGA